MRVDHRHLDVPIREQGTAPRQSRLAEGLPPARQLFRHAVRRNIILPSLPTPIPDFSYFGLMPSMQVTAKIILGLLFESIGRQICECQ
jgi:hypothetical protein